MVIDTVIERIKMSISHLKDLNILFTDTEKKFISDVINYFSEDGHFVANTKNLSCFNIQFILLMLKSAEVSGKLTKEGINLVRDIQFKMKG